MDCEGGSHAPPSPPPPSPTLVAGVWACISQPLTTRVLARRSQNGKQRGLQARSSANVRGIQTYTCICGGVGLSGEYHTNSYVHTIDGDDVWSRVRQPGWALISGFLSHPVTSCRILSHPVTIFSGHLPGRRSSRRPASDKATKYWYIPYTASPSTIY